MREEAGNRWWLQGRSRAGPGRSRGFEHPSGPEEAGTYASWARLLETGAERAGERGQVQCEGIASSASAGN